MSCGEPDYTIKINDDIFHIEDWSSDCITIPNDPSCLVVDDSYVTIDIENLDYESLNKGQLETIIDKAKEAMSKLGPRREYNREY